VTLGILIALVAILIFLFRYFSDSPLKSTEDLYEHEKKIVLQGKNLKGFVVVMNDFFVFKTSLDEAFRIPLADVTKVKMGVYTSRFWSNWTNYLHICYNKDGKKKAKESLLFHRDAAVYCEEIRSKLAVNIEKTKKNGQPVKV